jgi:hypothetical protein
MIYGSIVTEQNMPTTVLVVNKNESICEKLAESIYEVRPCLNVICVSSGHKAIEEFEKNKNNLLAVIIDTGIPEYIDTQDHGYGYTLFFEHFYRPINTPNHFISLIVTSFNNGDITHNDPVTYLNTISAILRVVNFLN